MNTKGADSIEFAYGTDHMRYKRTETIGGNTTISHYLGGGYERIQAANNEITHKYQIYANGNMVAVHIESDNPQVNQNTRYMHYDALGSIDLVTDVHGNSVELSSFDAFGKRRASLTQKIEEPTPDALLKLISRRGYTGHEHLDHFGLIHMNGRIYDSQIGRFLSADPTMQYPYSTQGQNRFAYVQNNPLKYVDKSGYGFGSFIRRAVKSVSKVVSVVHSVTKAAVTSASNHVGNMINQASDLVGDALANPYVRMAVAAAAAYYSGLWMQAVLKGGLTGVYLTAAVGATGGAVSSAVMSDGDPQAILAGAVAGALFGAVHFATKDLLWIKKGMIHGAVGGAYQENRGGSFKDGFSGAFFGAAMDNVIPKGTGGIKTGIVKSLAGGVGAKLGGGKFQNGAYSAAMAYILNDMNQGDVQKGDGFFKGLWKKATGWHFEGRDASNFNLPSYEQAIGKGSEWALLSPEQSIFHDNGVGKPELKFIHSDGREAVFNGDTQSLMTDAKYGGTYNYVNPAPVPDKWWDLGGWGAYAGKGVGHLVLDVVPYVAGGNVRGEN